MTLAHFLYIPGMLLLGCVVGYVLGGRASAAGHADADEQRHRDAAKEARRRAREGDPP